MGESSLTLAFSDYQAEVGWILGYSRDSDNWSAAQLAQINAVVQSGVRRFYYPPGIGQSKPHEWSFLKPDTSMVLWPDIALDDDVTVTATESDDVSTVTASEASFYNNMIGRSIVITSTGTFTITGYTSSTVVSVSGDATCTDKTFSMATTSEYQLPDDFAGLYGHVTFAADNNYPPIEIVGDQQVREWAQYTNVSRPRSACIRPKASTGAAGQRFELYCYPEPDAEYTVYFRYESLPSQLSSSYPYPLGGMQHSETILAFCLWTAAERIDDDPDTRRSYAMERLDASVRRDRVLSPPNLGYNSDAEYISAVRHVDGLITHINDV